MELRFLGPILAVSDEGGEIQLGGPKQRAVLALLVIRAGRLVETDSIVEELWPDAAAAEGARKTVQAYVSRLRRAFAEVGAGDVIQPRPAGYTLDPARITTDAERFSSAILEARVSLADRPAAAAVQLRAALDMWRGRPFADVQPCPALDLEAARLDEKRQEATELWAEAELAGGRHREILADLRAIADQNPLAERAWTLLILALYRSGRQGDATAASAEITRRLWDELGVEPGPELAEMQRHILAQDPELAAPAATRRMPRAPARLSRSKVVGLMSVVVVLAGVAALVVLWPFAAGGTEPTISDRYPVPAGATSIASTRDMVWIMSPSDTALVAISTVDGRIASYELPAHPTAMVAGLGAVWVASAESRSIYKVHPTRGTVLNTARDVDLDGAAMAVGSNAIYVIREHARAFLRLNPISLEVETLWFQSGDLPVKPSITIGRDLVWGANGEFGLIVSLDPDTPDSDEFAGDPRIEGGVRSVLADRGAVWFSQPTAGTISRLDLASREIRTVEVGRASADRFSLIVGAYGLAPAAGGVWVSLPDEGKVVILDDATGAQRGELSLRRPTSITSTIGAVWVLDELADEVVKVLPTSCLELPFIGPNADLRGCDLSGRHLVSWDLTGADLRWASLRDALLLNADLNGADLLGADLTGASLDGVIWARTRCPDGSLSDDKGGTCSGALRP